MQKYYCLIYLEFDGHTAFDPTWGEIRNYVR